MVRALTAPLHQPPLGGVESLGDLDGTVAPLVGDPLQTTVEPWVFRANEQADANDPFDDFEEDDFDDDFDDDFEEDWEDDLTEDDEFPDTFGGEEEAEGIEEADDDSPFADDPDFDDA